MYKTICEDVNKALDDEIQNGHKYNLLLCDPPYNLKKDTWDTFKNDAEYYEWCETWIKKLPYILEDTGSFYIFHNDFVSMMNLYNLIVQYTNFEFKQFIVWNKRFEDSSKKGFLDGYVVVDNLRNYQKMAEYILFFVNKNGTKTAWDKTGLTQVKHDTELFKSLRNYFKDLQEYIGKPKSEIVKQIGGKADHCFRWRSSQFELPTLETYIELDSIYNISAWPNFREYESLRLEYESLRLEYESLRYTFNNQKTHHSVWNYDLVGSSDHVSPKPVELYENIILHSSNQHDKVIDIFMGSGRSGVASLRCDRKYVGIENNIEIFKSANDRIEKHLTQKPLFPFYE